MDSQVTYNVTCSYSIICKSPQCIQRILNYLFQIQTLETNLYGTNSAFEKLRSDLKEATEQLANCIYENTSLKSQVEEGKKRSDQYSAQKKALQVCRSVEFGRSQAATLSVNFTHLYLLHAPLVHSDCYVVKLDQPKRIVFIPHSVGVARHNRKSKKYTPQSWACVGCSSQCAATAKCSNNTEFRGHKWVQPIKVEPGEQTLKFPFPYADAHRSFLKYIEPCFETRKSIRGVREETSSFLFASTAGCQKVRHNSFNTFS